MTEQDGIFKLKIRTRTKFVVDVVAFVDVVALLWTKNSDTSFQNVNKKTEKYSVSILVNQTWSFF